LQRAVDRVGALYVLYCGALADEIAQLCVPAAVAAVQRGQRGIDSGPLTRGGHDMTSFEQLTLHEYAVVEAELRRRADLLTEALDRRDLRLPGGVVLQVRVLLVQVGHPSPEQGDEDHDQRQTPTEQRRVVVDLDFGRFDLGHVSLRPTRSRSRVRR